jgi:hypothetical protein
MTPAHKPVFLVISHNLDLAELVKDILSSNNVTVKTSQPSDIDGLKLDTLHYIIFLIQRSLNDQNITSSLINSFDLAKKHQSKIAIIDIHKNEIQEEVANNSLQLLNQLSAGSPIFRYILTKDLFQEQNAQSTFTLEQDIQLASLTQKIDISSRGENLIYPLNLKDLVSAILKSLFLERLSGQKLTIIGDPLKDLDLAYIIKDQLEKINKTLDINTVKKDALQNSSTINASDKSRALLKWLPQDTNEDALKGKILSIITQPPSKKFSAPIEIKNIKPPKQINLHKTEKKFLISIPIILTSISIVSFLVISLISVLFLGLSLKKTRTSLDYLNKGDTAKTAQEIDGAIKYLQVGEDISHYVLPVYQIVSSNLTININNFTSLLKHSQSTIQSINESYQLANTLYHDLFTPSGTSAAKDISIAVQSRLRTIHQELSQIQIIQENHTFPNYFNNKLKDIDFTQKINILTNQTAQGLRLLESFSSLLNSSTTQQVVLLIQDNNELKSSGGTIRSIALANIENQKVTNIRLVSAGQVDQQMVGQIPAPPAIEALTGRTGLSFTNSNTSASFIENAYLINKFLKNSLNITPDLIVGITTQVLKDIDPSSEDTTFLVEKIIEGVQTQNLPLISFVRPVINTLNQDDLRVWFKDPATEGPNINYSLAGNIFLSPCHPLLASNNCFADMAYLAENNLSVAPFNLYQNRQVQHLVTVQGQSILHTFILDYKYNNVPQELNRDYQALYQIYLHPSAQFVSIEKDNQEQNIVVNKELNHNLSLFQIPLSHPPKGSSTIKINFILKNILPASDLQNFAYSIKTFHQPGTNIQNSQLIINHPTNLTVSGITSSASIAPGKIIYQPSTGSSLNAIFGVQFAY